MPRAPPADPGVGAAAPSLSGHNPHTRDTPGPGLPRQHAARPTGSPDPPDPGRGRQHFPDAVGHTRSLVSCGKLLRLLGQQGRAPGRPGGPGWGGGGAALPGLDPPRPALLTFPFLQGFLVPDGFGHQLPVGVSLAGSKLHGVKVDGPVGSVAGKEERGCCRAGHAQTARLPRGRTTCKAQRYAAVPRPHDAAAHSRGRHAGRTGPARTPRHGGQVLALGAAPPPAGPRPRVLWPRSSRPGPALGTTRSLRALPRSVCSLPSRTASQKPSGSFQPRAACLLSPWFCCDPPCGTTTCCPAVTVPGGRGVTTSREPVQPRAPHQVSCSPHRPSDPSSRREAGKGAPGAGAQ